MEKYTFFNDVDDDRIYFAEDFARHLATYFTNGVFNNGCQVLGENNDMSVNVSIGSANINGYRYDNDAIKTLNIDNADGVLNRIDNIVIRWDLTNRIITTQVIKGTFADNPVAPDVVRTSTIYDLRIAKINVPAGTTTITPDLITDTRFITSDCGNVISTVQTPDTEDLFIQIQEIFNKTLEDMQIDFNEWYLKIKDQLDEDAAGKLANNIYEIVRNDLKKNITQFDKKKINEILSIYNDIYSSSIEYRSYCPSNIFFIDRIYTRLQKWYLNSKKLNNTIIYCNNEKIALNEILNEIYTYFEKNICTKRQCVLTQGDPNTLNISTKPCFFDLATAGYNPIIGELAITIISTLIYDNYFCPKYHPKSYYLHETALEQYKCFEPKLTVEKNKNVINIKSNIITSNVRKKYILKYLEILENNNIQIDEEIKYYILMRLLCVFDIRKMDHIDYYYSLFMICYFYKNIKNDFYSSIRKIINEMESI